jgi:hypothetical protein
MRKPVFLVTRYSVVGKAQHTWNLAREATSHGEYKARLLEPERLRARLEVFRAVTIPSVLGQVSTLGDLNWIILISAEMPEAQLAELRLALQPVQDAGIGVLLTRVADSDAAANIELGVYPGMGMATRLVISRELDGHAGIFASVRLDDDDALSSNYLQALARYLKPEFVGSHISFPLGIQATHSAAGRPLTDARVVDKPLIALGLAFINSFDGQQFAHPEAHVLNFGNHSEVLKKTQVVYDREFLAYLRVLTPSSDLGDGQQQSHTPATKLQILTLGLSFKVKPAKTKFTWRVAKP